MSTILLSTHLFSCSYLKTNQASQDSQAMPRKNRAAAMDTLMKTPLARLMPAAGLKIVDAREGDLVKMQSGVERALAFRQSQRHKLLSDSEILDLDFPPEPALDDWLDGGLLPPKDP